MTKNATDTRVIRVSTTANTLPISPRLWNCRLRRTYRSCLQCKLKISNTGAGGTMRRGPSVRERLKSEIDSLRLAGADRHVLRLRAVLLLPSRQRILSGRKPLQAERPVLAGNCIVRSVQHHKIAVHPRMDVALHRNEFRLVVFGVDRSRSSRL